MLHYYIAKKIDGKYYIYQENDIEPTMVVNNPDQVRGDLTKPEDTIGVRMYDEFTKKDSNNITFTNDKCEKMDSKEWENAGYCFAKYYSVYERDRVERAFYISNLSVSISKNLVLSIKKDRSGLNHSEESDYHQFYSNEYLNMMLQKITGENWNVNSTLADHRQMLQEIEAITDNLPSNMTFNYDPVITDMKNIGEKYGAMTNVQKKTLSSVKKAVAEKKTSTEHTDEKLKSNGR